MNMQAIMYVWHDICEMIVRMCSKVDQLVMVIDCLEHADFPVPLRCPCPGAP
jgi:siroheme synthase (precorrin-2 oxidase/ferrochelatase)